MLRTTRALRRLHPQIRRRFHEDSRNDYLGFSSNTPPDPRLGMDMTRAPGYEIAADEMPLEGNQKLVDFAARHARLSLAQIGQAEGYMWVGSVLYPTNLSSDYDIEAPWERGMEEFEVEQVGEEDEIVEEGKKEEVIKVDRRYTGGQARRIRKEREKSVQRRVQRRLRKRGGAVRKPENDIPEDQEE